MNARPVALVTGAGRGIGRACALALVGRGFDVIINERSAEEDTADTVAAVTAAGGRAAVALGDVADLTAHEALLDAASAAFGRLDCLVNNAGVSVLARGDLLDVTPASFDRCLAVNTRGTFFLTQAFARRLLALPQPPWHRAIVFITSANVEVISISRGEYCVAKAAAAMVARLFAVRLAAAGIGVYEVRPGIIRTRMTEPSQQHYERFFAAGGAPLGRWGEPSEVGACVAALAAGALPYTVGQAVLVDGGLALKCL